MKAMEGRAFVELTNSTTLRRIRSPSGVLRIP